MLLVAVVAAFGILGGGSRTVEATSHTPCEPGFYDDDTACSPAPAGSFVGTTGAIAETSCAPGTYQPLEGQAACLLADPGYFVSTRRSVAQAACPVGFTSEAGATECYRIVNSAPVADPGGPYLVAVDTPVTLDGSASSDPEDDTLTYAWDFGDGNTGSSVSPSHTYADARVYDVCLIVNDGELNSAKTCTMVAVFDPAGGFRAGPHHTRAVASRRSVGICVA